MHPAPVPSQPWAPHPGAPAPHPLRFARGPAPVPMHAVAHQPMPAMMENTNFYMQQQGMYVEVPAPQTQEFVSQHAPRTAEKVVEAPQVQEAVRYVDVSAPQMQGSVRRVPLQLLDTIAEMPETQVPKAQDVSRQQPWAHLHDTVRYVAVPVPQVQEVVRHVPRVEIVERLVEVPRPVIQTVEKIVEVPQVQEVVRYVDVPVTQDTIHSPGQQAPGQQEAANYAGPPQEAERHLPSVDVEELQAQEAVSHAEIPEHSAVQVPEPHVPHQQQDISSNDSPMPQLEDTVEDAIDHGSLIRAWGSLDGSAPCQLDTAGQETSGTSLLPHEEAPEPDTSVSEAVSTEDHAIVPADNELSQTAVESSRVQEVVIRSQDAVVQQSRPEILENIVHMSPPEVSHLSPTVQSFGLEYKTRPDLKPAVMAMATERISSATCSAVAASVQGFRSSQEDDHILQLLGEHAAIFTVLDGHGGANAATTSREILSREFRKIAARGTLKPEEAKEAFQQIFIEADAELRTRLPLGDASGTTVVAAVVTQPSRSEFCVHLVHVGDSRAVMSCGGQLYTTVDHKPENAEEACRIVAAGGSVHAGMSGGPMRVDGKLAVARAFGDFVYKAADAPADSCKVSAVPDVQTVVCHPGDWLLLASDGVFDVMSNVDVQQFVDSNASIDSGKLMAHLLKTCIAKGSRDNCTGLLVHFTAGDSTPMELTREMFPLFI
eukprot:gnl/TRDRNA2_/TRDRNA2_181344_c0_seq1.p1 gnl/TRDRNA2_/TRDRNA2_181344_c0~~gnl/TRDRNA2_/TRDRNA2_181344_c0_seq1.p1  ORF type:complete len:785 (+),score=161.94 gnl/TRDRNA2_/TRDRNA2_181344_c0_seq1:215-2356(+)